VLLAHDKFVAGVTDPAFTYANRAALTLFEGTWDEIVGMPSRLSADDSPEAQEDRNRLLEQAAQLHSVGSTLALRRQQEHGAYLIEHAELRGFGPRELAMIITLVRFHPSRGISRRFAPYVGLSATDRTTTATLLGLLQLADALDTGHDQSVELEAVRRRGTMLELVIGGGSVTRSDGLAAITRAVRDRAALIQETLGLGVTIAVRAAA
jgi:exopolyphosphatase/guanosine-5'-triphosphate,3'-diphosphate pyrophosphatase